MKFNESNLRRSASGSKIHFVWEGSVQAVCGARATAKVYGKSEPTCTKCLAHVAAPAKSDAVEDEEFDYEAAFGMEMPLDHYGE